MEVDSELINGLIDDIVIATGVALNEEETEKLYRYFNITIGTYLITKNKTNVVILGDDFNVDLVKSYIGKHQDHTPTIGCVNNIGFCQTSGLSLNTLIEDECTIKLTNTRLDFDINYGGDSLTKPPQHSHRKRNKFKPNKISHKRRK